MERRGTVWDSFTYAVVLQLDVRQPQESQPLPLPLPLIRIVTVRGLQVVR